MSPVRLPLFPLNVVLLPGADMPLHIFEPRYRQMVRDCLDAKAPFGMLLALPNGIAGTGCTAEILEVTNRYEDGRCDILTVGREPFRVIELFTEEPDGIAGIELSYRIAAKLPMDLLWKQRVLELRSEAERQERLVAYLREWAPHLQKSDTVRARATGSAEALN